jgi:hypothetical protein
MNLSTRLHKLDIALGQGQLRFVWSPKDPLFAKRTANTKRVLSYLIIASFLNFISMF